MLKNCFWFELDSDWNGSQKLLLKTAEIEAGAHSVFWGQTAVAIMGGLSVATFLILLNLPAIYVILFGVKPPATSVMINTEAEVREQNLVSKSTGADSDLDFSTGETIDAGQETGAGS